MRVIEKTMALMEGLTPADIEALPPAHRERFAALCRTCWQLAERPPEAKPGILNDLKRGERPE